MVLYTSIDLLCPHQPLPAMATSKLPPPSPPAAAFYYIPLPPQPQDPNYIVLPFYRRRHSPLLRRTLSAASFLILAALLTYVFWPSDPAVKIVRLRLNKIHFQKSQHLLVDASLSLTLKVRNSGVYSLDYWTLDVAVGYRGKELGHVISDGGHVKALGSSYVDADLELSGVDLLTDVVFLLEDLAKGLVPFDTVTDVRGRLGLLFFGFPLKVKVSCEVLVDTKNQILAQQNCYPE